MKSVGIFLMIAALAVISGPAAALAVIDPGHVTGVVRKLTLERAIEFDRKMAALPGDVTGV